jgi:hypothetical protein
MSVVARVSKYVLPPIFRVKADPKDEGTPILEK